MSRVQQVGECGNCGGAVVPDHEEHGHMEFSFKVSVLRCVKCRGIARWPVLEMRERRRRDRLDRVPAAKAEADSGRSLSTKDSDGGSREPREAAK